MCLLFWTPTEWENKKQTICAVHCRICLNLVITPNKQSLNGVASRKLISMNVHACVLKLGYWHWYSKLYTQQNDTLVSLKDCYEETNPLRGRNLYSLNFVFIRSVIWELWPEIPAFCVPSTDQSFINFWSFGSDSMEIQGITTSHNHKKIIRKIRFVASER